MKEFIKKLGIFNVISIIIIFFTFSIIVLALVDNREENQIVKQDSVIQEENQNSININNGIEVVNFHATQRCVSCTAVGKYSIETIRTKFPEEYKNRKIIFKSINVDLPENKEIVEKYQATGSSLFLNKRVDGNDNIQEDTNVWRYVANQTQFVNYLEGKIKNLLN